MSEANQNTMSAVGTPSGNVSPLSSLSAVLWIAWFSLREMSRRRRLLSLAAINLLPVVVVLIVRIWYPDQGGTAQLQLSALTHEVFVPFLIPIVAIFVGVSAIGEQVEDGTIVYPWTRPVRRRAIYLGRLLAAQSVATLLLAGSLILCFLIMVSSGPGVITWDFLKLYFFTFLVIFLGVFAYVALFAAMGTFLKKPILPAILFAFMWEGVSKVPARVQELTLRFHLTNLLPQTEAPPDDLPGMLEALLTAAVKRSPVPEAQSVAVLVAVTLVTTAVGIWLLRQKEIDK
jgi:hypothetical protein|nr:ABC transporter permease subunit [Candidatus Krumholzibacteria bacterium]